MIFRERFSTLFLANGYIDAGNCVVVKYVDETITEWKRKTDTIHDIIELLGDEAVQDWKRVYYNNEDAYYEEDDE